MFKSPYHTHDFLWFPANSFIRVFNILFTKNTLDSYKYLRQCQGVKFCIHIAIHIEEYIIFSRDWAYLRLYQGRNLGMYLQKFLLFLFF